MPPLSGVQCSSGVCINYVYSYYGIDEQTFKLMCGIAVVPSLAGGAFFINRHNKAQVALKDRSVGKGPETDDKMVEQ